MSKGQSSSNASWKSFADGASHGATVGVTVVVLLVVSLGTIAVQQKWDWHSVGQKVFANSSAQKPDDVVYKMLDAARAGDTDSYLNCFGGEMRTQIEQVIKEGSRVNFANYLRNQNGRFTGVAVTVKDNVDDGSARVRVEYVFRERNEIQDFHLRRDGKSWQIIQVVGSEHITTLIPYGTAVTD